MWVRGPFPLAIASGQGSVRRERFTPKEPPLNGSPSAPLRPNGPCKIVLASDDRLDALLWRNDPVSPDHARAAAAAAEEGLGYHRK